MTHEEFEQILEERIGKMRSVLAMKAQSYAANGDKLHNFRRAAAFGRTSLESALMGMALKHLTRLMDMVDLTRERIHPPPEAWDEPLGDAINYLVLLEAVVREGHS